MRTEQVADGQCATDLVVGEAPQDGSVSFPREKKQEASRSPLPAGRITQRSSLAPPPACSTPGDGSAGIIVTKDEVDQILAGFAKALESSASSRGVEDEMQQLFLSHANVFDEDMQNFFIQNFIHEAECAKTFRTTVRRTSLVRRCLLAMYPAEKNRRTTEPSRWNASLVARVVQHRRSNSLQTHIPVAHGFIAVHAADVAQSIHHLLTPTGLGESFSPRTKCAAILAAIVHDVAGFIIGIVRPLFNAICQLPKVELSQCMKHLDDNLLYWQSELAGNSARSRED
ncbi:hypothetical protein FI667_g6517, partial [Globisporangium splendens]